LTRGRLTRCFRPPPIARAANAIADWRAASDAPVMKPRHVLPLLLAGGAMASAAPADAGPADAACARARPIVATLCLINRVRAERELHRLRFDPRLRRAALHHSRDMVAHHYFSHVSRSGRSPAGRIAKTGWLRGRARWTVGENLAWHIAPATPRSIVRAWLRSPPHRRILLARAFRVVGIGVARGTPLSSAHGGATYTADFGS
jgi:Cysteine-rich secretory protein family